MKIRPFTDEIGMGGQKSLHPVLVFARQDGTGGIDQPPARPRGCRGFRQKLVLDRDQLRQPLRRQPPFQFRLPPPGAGAAAGRIQQHQIEGPGQGCVGQGVSDR